MGSAPRWLPFAKANGWTYWSGYPGGLYSGKFNNGGVDWRRLRVIDACVSAGTC
jgi:hypothetical protein